MFLLDSPVRTVCSFYFFLFFPINQVEMIKFFYELLVLLMTKMNQIKHEMRDDYLFVDISTELNLETIKNLFETSLEVAKKNNVKLALIDMRKSKISLSVVERFTTGKFLAKRGAYYEKIACIAHADHFDGKFAENVAVNRGLSMFATTDENDAITWLLK